MKQNPDVLIVLEAEHPDKIDFNQHTKALSHILWDGKNHNKGVLVLVYHQDIDIHIHPEYDSAFQQIIPLSVHLKQRHIQCTWFAVWTKNTGRIYDSYVVQAHQAFLHYPTLFDQNSLIMGDFNSNAKWNDGCQKRLIMRTWSLFYSNMISRAIYHVQEEQQGEETCPTLFHLKNINKPYHVDYFFAGTFWQNKCIDFHIGQAATYLNQSDHMPLIAGFE